MNSRCLAPLALVLVCGVARAMSIPPAYPATSRALQAEAGRLGVKVDLGEPLCKRKEYVENSVAPSGTPRTFFSCVWTTRCATLTVAGEGPRPDVYGFEADVSGSDCGVDRLQPLEHAFIAASLECDGDGAKSAAIEQLAREPAPLGDGSPKESSVAQLDRSDILSICGAMHGFRRVYRVGGRDYRDIYLSRVRPK